MDRRPIGVFDSGVGGLTVMRELIRQFPNEKIIYFGDTARVPYGAKSKRTIVRFSLENILFLLEKKVKLVVVACNTSSSLALPVIKRNFNVPIIGVIEPAVKSALRTSRSGRIGVIGTRATIDSRVYERSIKHYNRSIKVFSKACPLFVPFVEEGWLDNKAIRDVAKIYLDDFKDKNIDTLILGCTHYPLLKRVIAAIVGKDVLLVDSGAEVALVVKKALQNYDLTTPVRMRHPAPVFFVSDEPGRFQKLGQRFLKNRIEHILRVHS
jgi:glutamate racemase